MVNSVQCLPERILVHYQFQMLYFQGAKSDYLGQLISQRKPIAPLPSSDATQAPDLSKHIATRPT